MSLFRSILTFSGLTLVSRLAGFLRDVIIAKYLGAGMMSDAFLVSFKLPNLFRSLFAEGAFNTSFVPMLSHKIVEDGKEKSKIFASKAISILTFFLTIFSIIIILFMPTVVKIMAPGFIIDPEKMKLTIELSRITFVYLLLVSIVSFQSGILNSLGKFAAPAAAPILLNITMASSVFVFAKLTPNPAYSLAIGVAVAGFIQILWLSIFLYKENYSIRPRFGLVKIMQDREIKTLFKRMLPGIFGAGVYQINIMIGTILVSLLGSGAVSWLYYADRLHQVPLGVVGAAIGVTLLPVLSKQIKSSKRKKARETQDKAVEYGFLLSLPAAIILITLSEPIINILFQRGEFGALETQMTYKALIAYMIGLPAYVMTKALAPNFFARGDTRTPVKYSIISLILNLCLILLFIKTFRHIGVAMATSLSAFISLGLYLYGLKKQKYWQFSKKLTLKLGKIFITSFVMAISILVIRAGIELEYPNWLEFSIIAKLFILAIIGIVALTSFLVTAKITGAIDYQYILDHLHKEKKVEK